MWKNLRKQYKNNEKTTKKIKALMQNDELEFPDGSYSVSDIQDYIEYIINKHKTLKIIPPIHVYINRTNHRLQFKIKD